MECIFRHIDVQFNLKIQAKKNLKIPKGQSEAVKRRTDNTMADRKRTKTSLKIPKGQSEAVN